jgi:hypothetical protein
MVAYNFQARFADMVERGQKTRTIRAIGKRRHAARGDKIELYTGMRTKSCRKLGDAVCIASAPVKITRMGFICRGFTGGQTLATGLDDFAQRDGFRDFDEMVAWLTETHGMPFEGQLIMWDLLPQMAAGK